MDIKLERDKEGVWLIIENQEFELSEEEFQQLAEEVTAVKKEAEHAR